MREFPMRMAKCTETKKDIDEKFQRRTDTFKRPKLLKFVLNINYRIFVEIHIKVGSVKTAGVQITQNDNNNNPVLKIVVSSPRMSQTCRYSRES